MSAEEDTLDDELPEEVDPAEGWEFAARRLIEVEAERIEQSTREVTRDLRALDDPSIGVARGSAAEVRTLITRLERLAEVVEAVDPGVADRDELEAVTDDGTNTSDAEGEA